MHEGSGGRTRHSSSKNIADTAFECPSRTLTNGPSLSTALAGLLLSLPPCLTPFGRPSALSSSSATSLRLSMSPDSHSSSSSTRRRSQTRTDPSSLPVRHMWSSTCMHFTVPRCPRNRPISSPESRSQTRGCVSSWLAVTSVPYGSEKSRAVIGVV